MAVAYRVEDHFAAAGKMVRRPRAGPGKGGWRWQAAAART
jgi:hypothetical protein